MDPQVTVVRAVRELEKISIFFFFKLKWPALPGGTVCKKKEEKNVVRHLDVLKNADLRKMHSAWFLSNIHSAAYTSLGNNDDLIIYYSIIVMSD